MKKIFALLALVLTFALNASADIAPQPVKPTPAPKQPKGVDTRLSIRLDREAKEARLLIPKSQLKQLRAEIEELDDESNRAAAIADGGFSRTQTIVSGLFLSLVFAFGGIYLARTRKSGTKASKTLVVGAGLFLSGALASVAFANIGPPPEVRSLTGKLFTEGVHQYKQASGKIKLEISDAADRIELIVPDPDSGETRSSGE